MAWATRRFGTVALAVTAAASIAAGYLLTPFLGHHGTAVPSVQRAVVAAPAAVPQHRAPPRAHHARVAPHAAGAAHHRAVVPHAVFAAGRHAAAAAPAVAPVVHPARVVRYAPAVVPAPTVVREDAALRAKLHAQQAEIARLRAQAAADAAAAHAARVRAEESAAAQPQSRPRTQPATRISTSTGTATTPAAGAGNPAAGSGNIPDTTAGPPESGAKTPPSTPRGGWSEHPPLPGPLGGVLGPRDSCTPQGGRVGAVINAILDSGLVRTNVRF
ncbi:MAG: hypothetical protein JOZ24_10410 [Candidatus Eremiobacteraeota bacterium]|nr:hypothetical protein [Candidatus Eremiobacteraeota bacterium]